MPETAALAGKTGPFTGHADVLAGESSVDEINTGGTSWRSSQPFSVGAWSDSDHVSASPSKCGRVHFANVVKACYLRPVALEHLQAPWIVFDLEHRLDARSLESQLEAADATEQRDRSHVSSSPFIGRPRRRGWLRSSALHFGHSHPSL
jgi:hypothetical protein